jgi:hypothetical protein
MTCCDPQRSAQADNAKQTRRVHMRTVWRGCGQDVIEDGAVAGRNGLEVARCSADRWPGGRIYKGIGAQGLQA